MDRVISAWKLTFDPTGSPVVLVNYGDIIEGEPKPKVTKPLEVVEITGADFPFLRPMGNRRFDLSFGVYQTAASGPLARRAILDSMLVVGGLGRKPLRIEVQGITGTYWQFANAWVNDHEPSMSVERGNPRNLKVYSITATSFTRTGP